MILKKAGSSAKNNRPKGDFVLKLDNLWQSEYLKMNRLN